MKNQGVARVVFIAEGKDGKYAISEEAHKVAAKLIDKQHSGLAECRIAYLFKDVKEWESKGKVVLAKTSKAPEQWQYLTDFDFVVIVNKKIWDIAPDKFREALMDHELSHIIKEVDAKGNPKWSIANHDVEEFSGVVLRHGLWKNDLKQFMAAAKKQGQQMSLDDMDSGDQDEKV